MKRLYKILLVFVLSLSIVGCNSNDTSNASKTENKDFAAFVETLPEKIIGTNGFDLNYTFHNPSEYGIEKELGDIKATSMKEYEESIDECEDLLKELKKFKYDSLTIEQQEEYDVLKEYLERSILLDGYAYFDNNYLGSYLGMQAQLPIILLEFELHDKQDLDSYLNVLKTAPEAFIGYAELEKERQEKGTGMSKVLLDGVIEQCENFANGDVTFLVEAMNEKIDAADFLSDEEKQQAKADNESYTKNEFMSAYTKLKEELQGITPKEKDGGIAQMKDGGEYYEALFQNKCGFDWDIDTLEKFLSDKQKEYRKEYTKLVSKYMDSENQMDGETYGDFRTPEENIDYLAEAYTKYFPDAGTMQYRVVDVPESMRDNFSPAAYLTSRVDRAKEEPLLILINGGYTNKDFKTIAHEGYPGHMYQDCYFQQLDVAPFRYLLGCNGYSEGWATYIEGKAHWFTKNNNENILKANEAGEKFSSTLMAQWDIDINYHGMTREEFKDELDVISGGNYTEQKANEQYDILLENPTNYLMYFVNGLYFDELYTKAEKELGKNFDPIEFHKVLLDIGPVGMGLLTEKVDAYIEENK